MSSFQWDCNVGPCNILDEGHEQNKLTLNTESKYELAIAGKHNIAFDSCMLDLKLEQYNSVGLQLPSSCVHKIDVTLGQ